jgi:hypothetical protein
MLMRTKDFLRLGGFDERYFYGYEDVELCLRAGQAARGRRQITCRNDLVALHRHGYSRLSGRQPEVTRKLTVNQQVFARRLGLWAKQTWWQSLIEQDGLLCGETLTLGVVYDELALDLQGDLTLDIERARQARDSAEVLHAQSRANAWAKRLRSAFGKAQILLYPRSAGWGDFSQAHLLWVLAPSWAQRSGSQLRRDAGLRADCRAFAVIDRKRAARWSEAEGSALCGYLLDPNDDALSPASFRWPDGPRHFPADSIAGLQHLAQPLKRLFIALHTDQSDRAAKVRAKALVMKQAQLLRLAAADLGMLVLCEVFSPGSVLSPPVAEIVVHIFPGSARGRPRSSDDLEDALYVSWIVGNHGRGSTPDALQGFHECWSMEGLPAKRNEYPRNLKQRRVAPDAASVRTALKAACNVVEQRIGRAFSSP